MEIKQKYLTPNEYSRPQRKLEKVKAIVLHWLAAPRGTPQGVYNYFEERKKGKTGYGSAHFCVGMDGEVMQYMPMEEMAYHVGSKTYTDYGLSLSSYPNNCTIGIEMSHIDWEGSFTDETWDTTVELTAMLLKTYDLGIDDITTHMKIVGWKDCPRWFKTFPKEFDRFKEDVRNKLSKTLDPLSVTVKKNTTARVYINGKALYTIPENKSSELLKVEDGWFKVSYDEHYGWIPSKNT